MLHEFNKSLVLNRIDFHKSADDLAEDYSYLSDNDKLKIQYVDSKSTFDYEDEHFNYSCYLLIEQKEIDTYKKVLDDNLIPYICHDLTQNVIHNKINLSKSLRKHVNGTNVLDYNIFVKDVDDWIFENLDLDSILDRINELGIGSLREVDTKFLKTV
jgi:hypothetical protein